MTRFGIEKVLYYCPEIKRKVVLSLYYGIYKNQRVYTSIDCENKSECNTPKDEQYHYWQNCPAYKIYISPEYK